MALILIVVAHCDAVGRGHLGHQQSRYPGEEADGSESLRAAFERHVPYLATLDPNLGADDEHEMARVLRQTHDVPIIMVTGKDDVIDRVVGLELGQDDFLTKPFHIKEVLALVRAVLRRTARRKQRQDDLVGPDSQLDLEGLKIDLERMVLIDRNGNDCDLTTEDFKVIGDVHE